MFGYTVVLNLKASVDKSSQVDPALTESKKNKQVTSGLSIKKLNFMNFTNLNLLQGFCLVYF